MSTDLLLFTLFYILMCCHIIYPPIEFVTGGFTISAIFSNYLGSEYEQFIQYHIRKTSLTLFIHSLLPFGYTLILIFYGSEQVTLLWNSTSPFLLQLFTTSSFIAPILALYKIYVWSYDNWKNHPICMNLQKFCDSNTNWIFVASEINIEYRRVDKVCIETNSVIKVIVTSNWLLKITPYNLQCAPQSDTGLIVCSSDTHVSIANRGEIQYINIEVKSTKPNVAPFFIRLNTLDFKDLQDRWFRPIAVLPTVTFHKTLMDRFIDAFREQVKLNTVYETNQPLDACLGCLQTLSNVKIQHLCEENWESPSNSCTNCSCRPLWCVECLARWFASRQDQQQPETWMGSKCTCPVCRAKFCIWDISLVKNQN